MKSVNDIKEIIRPYKRHFLDWYATRDSQVRLYNSHHATTGMWLRQFLLERVGIQNYTKKHVALIHVGRRKIFELCREPIKLFYTIENVHVPYSRFQECEDLFLDDKSLSLSLGFDYLEHDKYLRFPYWLMAHFKPTVTYQEVQQWCDDVNNFSLQDVREKSCAFICRYDYFGDRTYLANMVNKVLPLNFPSLFMHNDDDLQQKFKDNKHEYLKQFKFNLCPENSSNEGYVTEKIFDAIAAGCVPIYWGNGGGKIESDIVNNEAVIFLKHRTLDRDLYTVDPLTLPQEDNSDILKQLLFLNENHKAYVEFASQPRLLPGAADVIYGYFESLENKIRDIIS